jgi:hypothetical protein
VMIQRIPFPTYASAFLSMEFSFVWGLIRERVFFAQKGKSVFLDSPF